MENNSTLEKILKVFNRNPELLRLVGATEKFAEKKAFAYGHFLFYLFCRCLHLSCQISIESFRNIFICSLNILMTVLDL